jgi:hypothetical protein
LGELDRDKTLEMVLVRLPRGGGLEVGRGRLVVDALGDSSLKAAAADRVLLISRIGSVDVCPGDCRGSPFLGEFMDKVDHG